MILLNFIWNFVFFMFFSLLFKSLRLLIFTLFPTNIVGCRNISVFTRMQFERNLVTKMTMTSAQNITRIRHFVHFQALCRLPAD